MKKIAKPKMAKVKKMQSGGVAKAAPKKQVPLTTYAQDNKARELAAKKKSDMAAKKEAARRKSIGITGRIKEDVKKVARDLKGSAYGRL
jgi:hypothetical protein